MSYTINLIVHYTTNIFFQIKYTEAIYQTALGYCYGLKLPTENSGEYEFCCHIHIQRTIWP